MAPDATFGDVLWDDPTLVGDLRRLGARRCASRRQRRSTVSSSTSTTTATSAFVRTKSALAADRPWWGIQAWAVPAAATEFPVGAPARITGVDLRGYVDLALYLGVGTSAGDIIT